MNPVHAARPTRESSRAEILQWGLEGPRGAASAQLVGRQELRALVVGEDAAAREPLGRYLHAAGFEVREVESPRALLALLASYSPDLVVLDLERAGENTVKTCARVRGLSDAALVLVTPLKTRHAGLIGLETGADDYLVKPFAPRELLARAKAILRRRANALPFGARLPPVPGACYRFGPYTFSPGRRMLTDAWGAQIILTESERRLLGALLAAGGKVLRREELEPVAAAERSPRAHTLASSIYLLRRKLRMAAGAGSLIGTVRSVGYVMKGRIQVTYE
jgi:two-component system OmpR family response regulator